MQHFYKFITWRFYVWLNMFRTLPRPSSGAYNCISNLWFYRWSVVVAALLVVVSCSYNTAGLEDTTNQAPHGTRDCMCSWEVPDDGHNGVRNM